MKQKNYLLLLFLFLQIVSFGQTLDQSYTPTINPFDPLAYNISANSTTGENPGQSFTAGSTNVLSRVAIYITNASSTFVPGTFELKLYSGSNATGTLLNTTAFTISTAPSGSIYQEFEINLSPAVPLTSGSVYSFTITGVGTAKVDVGIIQNASPIFYTGGEAFIYTNVGLTGYDAWFKTYMGAVATNTAPTDISLSATSINENVAANTIVGALSTTDPDVGNTFTYTLVAGTGSTDNASFNISGNSLRISNSPDFEVKNSYAIRLRTTDQGGLFFEKQYTITINNVNETPTDITLSLTSVNENVAANTTVGALGSTDPDAGNTFTYTLVAGTGSTDNASFNISGSNLRITNSPNFEAKSSYTVRLRTTDQGGLFFEKPFTITINNVNETPTDISLSATSINENVAANTTVGTLSSTDPDAGNTFTYTLVAGTGSTDNASFNISGTSLRITNSPDFETKSSYAIRLRTTDQGGLFFEKQYTITINDLVESTTAATHLNFDGVDDLVNCGTSLNTVLDPLNTITVEAWVRPSTNTALGVIVGNYANSNQSSMQFLLRRENNNYGFWIQGDGIFKNVTATNAVVLNTWQHVVGVWNGSDLKIYINGVLAGTTTGVTDSSFASTTNSMIIGNNQFSGNPEEFTGSIDEVRIWSSAKTIEQLNGSKNCELQGTESGLLAYYNFNQGIDQANNSAVTTLTATTGPNGTLTNFALNGSVSNWLAGSPVTTGSIVPSVATVTTPVFYAQGATATALTATVGANGTGLLWYTTATGGVGSATAPTPSTAAVGNTSYWVSSTNANGCESPRTEVVVTVSLPATHLNFDGTNDFVNLGTPISTALNGTSTLTLEAWINPSALNGWNNIITDYDGSYHKFLLRVRNSNNIQFWLNGTVLNSTFTVPLNTWTHVAAVYDGANMYVYANGNLIASQAASVTLPATSNQVNIGARIGSNTENFTGNIDDVRVWNVVRTAEQINGSKNCELQGTESGLLAYYKFNQGVDQANNSAVTTLNATTGSNGTLTNFALNSSVSNWLAGSPVTAGSIVPSVATVTTPVVYAQGATASALTATVGANGTGLLWYTTATGGVGSATAPTPSTATVGNTSYWVSSTNANGCESARTEIVVTVSLPATHLNFDGSNDMVGLGSSLSSTLNGANFFTAEAWINVPNTTGIKTIVGNHISNGAQFNLRLDGSRLNGFLGFGAYGANTSVGSISANTWHHVAMVYNDTTLKLYIDGVEAASVTIPLAYSLQTSAQPYMIGSSGYGGEFFNGSIDEVKIWNIAKTPDQLLATKNCELQGSEPGLIAYYKFNQGVDQANNSAITTLSATTGPNGTITNFALNGTTSNFLAGSPVATGSIVPSVASVTTPIIYNQGATASALTATVGANGIGLMWYTTATGGTGSAIAPTPSTATAGNTSYWVSSTNANGCESDRTEIVVNVIVANDECSNAINLSVGTSSFNDFPVNVNLTTATNSGAPAPTCGNFQGGDVWYTVTVPASGNVVVETDGAGIYNTGLEVYTGNCGTLSLLNCDDNSGNGDYSKIIFLGQTPGTVLYVRVWENVFGISNAQFQVSAYDYIVPATHLNFDGVNDFVVSTNAVTNNTENQTYQAWFRIPSIPANSDLILQRGNDGTGGWSVQVGITSAGNLYAGISASPDTFTTGTTVLTPNTWYQVTFVFENNNSLRLYLNGNLEASTAIGNRTLRNSDNRLRIGTGNIASEHFNGDIDEVRVWNKVLNATDILNTMNCELQASETGLVAYYKFNQGNDSVNNSTVTSLLDSSSNVNNGTLTGFALTGTTSNWRSGSTITTGNTCATLGNSDFENVTSITIYPNPSTGIFNVVSQQVINVEIYDLLGKLVYNQQLTSGTNSIDISNLNAGVYLLKATDLNGNSQSNKLIKN